MNREQHFGTWHDLLKNAPVPTKELISEYKTKKVYPVKSNIFRAFRECPLDNLKVVILGQDPYHNVYNKIPSACGVAFATENGYINPSARIIIKEIKESIPNSETNNPVKFLNWCSQGVLLLNTALTVVERSPKSHSFMWKNFTEYTITKLSKHKKVVWLLMGNDSKSYRNIIYDSHIVSVPHPASEIYSGYTSGFIGSNCFNKVNEILTKDNKEIIKW